MYLDDEDLDFSGAHVDYRQSNPSPSMFHTLGAGQSVTTVVNAALSHKLDSVSKGKVTALQHLKYVIGETIPSNLKDMSFCPGVASQKVDIIPDQKKAAAEHFSKINPASSIQRRDLGIENCSADQQTDLQTSVNDAVAMASAAQQAEGNEDDYWINWFKDAGQASTTDSIYGQVINAQSTGFTISCSDTYGACGDNGDSALAVTITPDNVIIPCPNGGYWDLDEFAGDCGASDYDKAGAILHEMSKTVSWQTHP